MCVSWLKKKTDYVFKIVGMTRLEFEPGTRGLPYVHEAHKLIVLVRLKPILCVLGLLLNNLLNRSLKH